MKESKVSTLSLTPPPHSILKPTIPAVGYGGPLPIKSEGGRGSTDCSNLHLSAHGQASATIKRFVILSSAAAISSAKNPGKVYTEEDWNDAAIDAVKEHGGGCRC